MKNSIRAILAFLAVLFAADYACSETLSFLRSFLSSLSSFSGSWVESPAGPEIVEALALALVFFLAGLALAVAVPRPFSRASIAALLGAGYSGMVFLFLPFLPGARGTMSPGWLLALASAPYFVPALASAAGAVALKLAKTRLARKHAA
jgi:hypothetical protein